jgi:AcrR family transcriptional regulator
MTAPSESDQPAPGLRERKKARTRATIQRQALRLFREQGYDATTIEQIAEAAEVSPSTFFRYFPTKEDVVLYDNLDPLIIEAFRSQPAEMGPTQAFREATRSVFQDLPPAEIEEIQERVELIVSVPELRARMLEEFTRTIGMISELVADRLDRPRDDVAVLSFAGALLGIAMAVTLSAAGKPSADYLGLLDRGLEQLEEGFDFDRGGRAGASGR